MNTQKNLTILAGFVLSISLLSASFTAGLLTDYHNRLQMQIIGGLCREIMERQPQAKDAVLSALKEYKYHSASPADGDILLSYGYRPANFLQPAGKNNIFFTAAGFLSGGLLFLFTLILCRKKQLSRIKSLTEYLERINTGSGSIFLQSNEDDFSGLQDEIYKTVTELLKTREAAVKAKNNFAENLYNIAHQLKTPVTAISLSVQRVQETISKPDNPPCTKPAPHLAQMKQQLTRLTHLEEALLLLSRIDAGTLSLERKETDLFTLLTLAADNLQELSDKAGVFFDIPESGEILIAADLDWTMEALINLFKNCMEHTPRGGSVHCAYEQNPLYTQIRIWDSGSGFEKEDIPRLFERFYRGKSAAGSGIGIGLAISKAIIESQNGTITAQNLPEGGALFEIRFYSH